MAAPQNGPVEITRTVADLGGMTAPRYEEMTGEELAQTVADLSGMSLEEVKTDGVQTSLVALHMSGGVPEDRQEPDCLPQSDPGSECTGSACSGCATGVDDWSSED